MRLTSIFLILCLTLLISIAAIAQGGPPPPEPPSPEVTGQPNLPPPPAPAPEPPNGVSTAQPAPQPPAAASSPVRRHGLVVVVGPKDSAGNPRGIRGKVTIITNPMASAKAASVELFFDSKSLGTASSKQAGFGFSQVDFDTTTVGDGPHSCKAVGKDSAGKEVWTAITNVEVRNNRNPMAPSVKQTPAPAPAFAKPAVAKTQSKPATAKPLAKAAPLAKPNAAVKPGKTVAVAQPGALSKAFTSAKYGFSIHYPAGWVTSDKTTAMKPKKAGNGWIEFSAAKKSDLVVNVRRMRLDAKSDADTFAKYNKYVNTWQRKTVLDAQAFSTNTDTGNKIIHRLIVIKDGYAWMLNCVDAAGKTSDTGQKLFDEMANSFAPLAKNAPAKAVKAPAKAVTIKTPAKASVKIISVKAPAKAAVVKTPAKPTIVKEPAKAAAIKTTAKPIGLKAPAKAVNIKTPAKPAGVKELPKTH